MDFQWHELSGNKYRYKTAPFTDNLMGKRFSRLNHEFMLIAVASYGGPIAITSDKKQILTLRQDDPTIDFICLFNNEGQITSKIRLNNPFQNIIVHLQFLQDEFLLAIFQKGQLWLIDPLSETPRRYNMINLLQTQQIEEAKVFQNGFAVRTSMNRFLFMRNASQPQLIQFKSCQQQLRQIKGKKLFWTVFSPKLIISEKVELHLSHPVCGVVRVVQDQSKRVFYDKTKNEHVVENKLPNIKGITYISELSPNKKTIAYFSVEPLYKQNPMEQFKKKKQKTVPEPQAQPYGFAYRIVFAPSLTSDTISSNLFSFYELTFIKGGVHLNQNGQPMSMKWCGNKAMVIQFFNNDLYMYSVDGDYIRIEKDRSQKNKWSFIKQQIDGLRIISKQQNKIMRQIPSAYINIFESFSQEPGALLYSAYQAFEDQAPLQDDQIRKQKKKLAVGVEQCIRASRFQLNFEVVTRLMKAASYGKAFLPPNMLPNNLIFDTSKMQRLVFCLRNKLRYITLDQLQSLSDDLLLKILLRYREHYLAFEIYKYLKKDQNFRIKIFTDWACCKVQNRDQSEEEICEQIRQKLQSEKGISFTQIAHKAIQVDRGELALRLLRYEPSLSKKVPLLLWMGAQQTSEQSCYRFYEKALEESLRSRDLNLLFLAIRKIMTSQRMGRDRIFDMFSIHKQGRYALINYFRLFDSKSLLEYYQFYLNDSESVIMLYLKKSFEEKKYDVAQELFQCAIQILKGLQISKQDWRKQVIPKVFSNLCLFIKEKPQIKYKNEKVKPAEITKQLQLFLGKKDSGGVDDVKDFYKMNDRRVIMGQIKVFIDQRKWEDLETFVERHQKKYNIPVELIADILLKKRQDTWAMRMIARMPDKHKEQQYQLLQKIGRNKEAIDLASSRKDVDTLQEIQSRLIDANLLAYATEKINLLKRR